MKDDLLRLAEYADELAKEVLLISSEASKLYSIELIKALINFSPIDTSELVSNWVVNINIKPEVILRAHYKGKKGSTAGLSKLKAITDALNIIKNIKPGDKVYLSNLAPQVVYTNYGTTQQEPQYFIERAMQLAQKTANSKELNIKLDAKR